MIRSALRKSAVAPVRGLGEGAREGRAGPELGGGIS